MTSNTVQSEKPFQNSRDATREFLRVLKEEIPFGIWMLTRKYEDDWIVIQCENSAYDIKIGEVLDWNDSFCSQMSLGLGPNFALSSDSIPAYRNAPINAKLDIGAYIGIPLYLSDGTLFGTLCAIDPKPAANTIYRQIPYVKLCARMLSSLINAEIILFQKQLETSDPVPSFQIDERTGLLNRSGWDSFIAKKLPLIEQLAIPTYILVIEIQLEKKKQSKTPQTHKNVAKILKNAHLNAYFQARLADDIFCLAISNINNKEVKSLIKSLKSKCKASDVDVNMGFAKHLATNSIVDTVSNAFLVIRTSKNTEDN